MIEDLTSSSQLENLHAAYPTLEVRRVINGTVWMKVHTWLGLFTFCVNLHKDHKKQFIPWTSISLQLDITGKFERWHREFSKDLIIKPVPGVETDIDVEVREDHLPVDPFEIINVVRIGFQMLEHFLPLNHISRKQYQDFISDEIGRQDPYEAIRAASQNPGFEGLTALAQIDDSDPRNYWRVMWWMLKKSIRQIDDVGTSLPPA